MGNYCNFYPNFWLIFISHFWIKTANIQVNKLDVFFKKCTFINKLKLKIMHNFHHFHESYVWIIPLIIVLVLWDAVWKLIAMWKAGRNNHLAWFICIALFNTVGILPIVYILMQRKNEILK